MTFFNNHKDIGTLYLIFAALSIYLDDLVGYIFVIFILTIAAVESAVGLWL